MATNVPLAPYVMSTLVSDGSSNGTIVLASTASYRTGATVWLSSATKTPVQLTVANIPDSTHLSLRDPSYVNFTYYPAAAFLVADGAVLVQNIQPDLLAANWL